MLELVVQWLTLVGEQAGNFLIYSSAYLAVIAMVYVGIVMVLLDIPANPAPIVGGFVAFAVYSSDRLVDIEADEKTNPERTEFVQRYEGPLTVLAAIAYGLAVALAVLGGPIALAVTLIPGGLWILYATDWIPGIWFHVRRLKEILLVNSTVVAIAWAGPAILLPMTFTNTPVTLSTGFVLAYFFLRSFTNSEIPNVRDIDGDRAVGVNTLPVVMGIDRTRRLLYGLDLLTAFIVVYGGLTGHLPILPSMALIVGLGYSFVVTSLLGRVENGTVLAIAAECEYVIVGLALIPVVYGP